MNAISASFKKFAVSRPAPWLRENFGVILTTFASLVSAIATYFLVTSAQLSQESQRLAMQAQKTASDITKQHMETAQMLERMLREARSSDMSNAKTHQQWVKDLQGKKDRNTVHVAAVSLALGGASNFPAIVAALLDPSQQHGDKVIDGLRIASLIDANAVCVILLRAHHVAEKTTAPSLDIAQQELRCPPTTPATSSK